MKDRVRKRESVCVRERRRRENEEVLTATGESLLLSHA